MKHSKLFMCLLVLVLTFSFISCSNDVKTQVSNSSTLSKALFEMEKLTSEDELNAFANKGDDDIVDWQLSMEFAQLWLESGIEAGDYPVDSELWELPIVVYNADGEIQYYEFRVVSEGEVVAAITGAARKEFGCPIIYEFLTDGYADEITKLYTEGKLSTDELPRIIDNGYPSVVVGKVTETRGVAGGFDEFLNPETGDNVNEEDIIHLLTYEEAKEICPEMLPDYITDEKMQALISDYKENGEDFWNLAVANKGHIADFAVRGGSKSKLRTEIDSGFLDKYWKEIGNKIKKWGNRYYYDAIEGSRYIEDKNKIINYGAACASVATGFVLDYIHANFKTLPEWDALSYEERHNALYSLLGVWHVYIFDKWKGDAAWWWNLDEPIKKYTNNEYSVYGSGVYSYPKEAINRNLPGISMRTWKISTGSFGHYRPIIAYKVHGWLCFSWTEFKVLDLVDCTDKKNGSWETFIPLYHLGMYDVK